MSAIGTKQTWTDALQMSAFGGKADIARTSPLRAQILSYKPWRLSNAYA